MQGCRSMCVVSQANIVLDTWLNPNFRRHQSGLAPIIAIWI
jgi:hypothetical protein